MMRYFLVTIGLFLLGVNCFADKIQFENNFNNYSSGTLIAKTGFKIQYNKSYKGEVIGEIAKDNSNGYLKLITTANGAANIQLLKNIQVKPNTNYTFSVKTKSSLKRYIAVRDNKNASTLIKSDLFQSENENEWITTTVTFNSGSNSQIKLVVYQNWSGTLAIDDFEVINKGEEKIIVTKPTPRNYYLSATIGSDKNNGEKTSPWKTLEKITNTKLHPGDTVFFKKGDRFDGHFVVNGSGNIKQPIVVSSYGKGALPIITGEVGEKQGGDYREAILVKNNDHISFEKIEVHNERKSNRKGISEQDAYAILILNTNKTTMEDFSFDKVVFRNVYAPKPVLKEKGEQAFNNLEVSAVTFLTNRNDVGDIKQIRDVIMQNCYFENLQRLGVHIKHKGAAKGIGTEESNSNVNFVFRNNEFHHTGGTCILPIRTYNCLIEGNIFNYPGDNSDHRMPARGSSVWTWRCVNTVIQYNQCLHIRGYLDSHGVHIDHENVNTFIQYNYMEDCEGGFVEILGGNMNSVYRYNVSVNDGWRNNLKWKTSNHTIWLNSKTPGGHHLPDNNYIYNNTIYMDSAYATSIDMKGLNSYVFNNLFYIKKGSIGTKQVLIEDNGGEIFISNNYYHGDVAYKFTSQDKKSIKGKVNFLNVDNGSRDGFITEGGSTIINAGINKAGPELPGARTGIFKYVSSQPRIDFYGNPINPNDPTPNIGACNLKVKAGDKISTSEIKLTRSDAVGVYDFNVQMDSQVLSVEVNASIQNCSVEVFDKYGRIRKYVIEDDTKTIALPLLTGKCYIRVNYNGYVITKAINVAG
ncbi:hypothetical protein [Flammeovirga pectinis]|nr:hypothetical protein [Flammeovirga pectinis]